MDDLYEARNSIYCYENSDVLVNKLNIKDIEDLNIYEAQITALKLLSLRQKGITGDFNINHILGIHKYIFEDIYPFAGLIRTENIAKDDFRFAEWRFIENELKNILNELKSENYLKDLSKESFSERLAYYMAELNVLHPFREGNGRTIREFIRQISLKNRYILNLRKVEPTTFLEASIISVNDIEPLKKVLFDCLDMH